jgi:DNA (cytosine-5)-methyltransferase 1
MMLVLSIFPGIDLLGMAFEQKGFCVVRGPDKIFGGDIRTFFPPSGVFDGIIGGSPCQDFSVARRSAPTGYGLEMLREFERVVDLAKPAWWLLENVPTVPDLRINGYNWQRFPLLASDCGGRQHRLRHFQWGSRDGALLHPLRSVTATVIEPAALATEGARKNRRAWPDFCRVQGLPSTFDLPGFQLHEKYRAVGNGVPLEMGLVVAQAVIDQAIPRAGERLCRCGCGELVTGKALMFSAACRKREQARRARAWRGTGNVTDPGGDAHVGSRVAVIVQDVMGDGGSQVQAGSDGAAGGLLPGGVAGSGDTEGVDHVA